MRVWKRILRHYPSSGDPVNLSGILIESSNLMCFALHSCLQPSCRLGEGVAELYISCGQVWLMLSRDRTLAHVLLFWRLDSSPPSRVCLFSPLLWTHIF